MTIHKVSYWIMRSKSCECYHLRGKTKKEVLAKLEHDDEKKEYEIPEKVCIDYISVIELLNSVLGEGGESTAISMSKIS